jgi:hypothetical protein
MRRTLRRLDPVPDSAAEAAQAALDFIGTDVLRQAFPSYQRQPDFDRVWNGFTLFMQESLLHADTWAVALDEFEGLGQIALMTIHKSKGLEFHTMIFYGFDTQTWWSLRAKSDVLVPGLCLQPTGSTGCGPAPAVAARTLWRPGTYSEG